MKHSCLLSELPPHTTAVIVRLDSSDALGKRLTDLGVTEGERITAEFKSPFGDPATRRSTCSGCWSACAPSPCAT